MPCMAIEGVMKKCGITILGSTGSIGQNTLNVIGQHTDIFEVIALSAYSSVDLLFEQCCYFKPAFAVMVESSAASHLKMRLEMQGSVTKVLSGEEGLCFIAKLEQVSKVVAAIVGSAGLLSTLSAIEAGKQVLIANKEALVMAGDLLISRAQETGAVLLPVDSEHNALFQCMPHGYVTGNRPKGVHRLILTASGGPFLHADETALSEVTPEMACQHPNWKMGKKITVDCASLMNKGLEVIEACKLFQMTPEEIEVIIHPQSIIHSLVEYIDGSFLAQLGTPDMRIPITNCLGWPTRLSCGAKRLSLAEIGKLTFFVPDTQKFKCLSLAYEALSLGKAATAVLNASNEVAVHSFLNKEMSFLRIPAIIEGVLQKLFDLSAATLQEILWADKLAREQAVKLVQAG